MTPIQFGDAGGARLFGLFHPPGEPSGKAVLLCPPFGQESIRTHRLYRVLAERLARAGHAVLRFDYRGTGDSAGEDTDGTLTGWCDDLLAAHAELMRRSAATQVTWIGLRLGASLAITAAAKAPSGLRRVVACEPIVDGAAYLALLRERHVAEIESVLSLRPRPSPVEVALADPESFKGEALGFALSPTLRAELARLRLDRDTPKPPVESIWIDETAAPAGPGIRSLAWKLEETRDWLVDTADNGTLIPARLMMQIMKAVEVAL